MYYNRIIRAWVVDPFDYFLLSAILGSIAASFLKDYLSEKKSMERLKNSIIKKSKIITEPETRISNFKELKIRKIYRVALGYDYRGGQNFQFQIGPDYEFSNEVFKLAQSIKRLVERLAVFLKERELKGVARIFFKNGRLLLELILYRCKIDITYSLLTEGLSTQVIVITSTIGGAAGFTLSWFSAGASLVAPPVLISVLLIRSVVQQMINQKDYAKFKKFINQILEDDELKETLRAFFVDTDIPTTRGIEMTPWNQSENSLPTFNPNSNLTWEEFIKLKMKEELGLVEDPTPEQIQEMLTNRVKNKSKGKTVYFRDFIDQTNSASDPDLTDIVDAEIVDRSLEIKVKNEEL